MMSLNEMKNLGPYYEFNEQEPSGCPNIRGLAVARPPATQKNKRGRRRKNEGEGRQSRFVPLGILVDNTFLRGVSSY